MSNDRIKDALAKLSANDFQVDAAGRVIISNPELAQLIKPGLPGDLEARSDTNIICCGNGSCASKTDSLLDQVIRSRM
ncbi:MAG TPA: hypothetical protein ENJ79_11400 [Gammaproteobacteria bacterium]|nr:hypothetical protein [Gammaproteobacteria bacterium]